MYIKYFEDHTLTRRDAFNFSHDSSFWTIHLTHLFNNGSPALICKKCMDSKRSKTLSSEIVIDPVYIYSNICLNEWALIPRRGNTFVSLKKRINLIILFYQCARLFRKSNKKCDKKILFSFISGIEDKG